MTLLAESLCKRDGGGRVVVNELRAKQDLLSVGRVAECRVRVVGDDLRQRLERVLPDVVFVVHCQLDRQVMDAI